MRVLLININTKTIFCCNFGVIIHNAIDLNCQLIAVSTDLISLSHALFNHPVRAFFVDTSTSTH